MWKSEIEKIMRHDDTFIGCYPHDRLPNFNARKNFGTIINTGDSGTIGEHWVAIKMTKHDCFYFDSFGLKIIEENIKKFASNYDKVIYSNRCIQDFRSEKCGQFCIAFLKNVKTVNQYDRFINMFDDCNLYMNDFIVHDIVKKYKKFKKNIKNIKKGPYI